MKQKIPTSPFATRLSGSARETELRLRSIFQWKKKRPPAAAMILAALAACSARIGVLQPRQEEPPADSDIPSENTAIDGSIVSEDMEEPQELTAASGQDGLLSSKIEVMFLPWESLFWQEPMEGLTEEQKELLADLPVDELPRKAVELWPPVSKGTFWRDTLIPLAADEGADVTLYGVVAEESLTEDSVNPQTLFTDGIVLRSGDQALYYPLSWAGNAWRGGNPWMSVQDYDGDGKSEAAICFLIGTGTGISVSKLYFFDLDTMTYTVPDVSAFGEIEVEYDPAAHTATLTSAADT